MADNDRFPEGDKRNCPKCGMGMEHKAALDDQDEGLCIWQCPSCKNVEVI